MLPKRTANIRLISESANFYFKNIHQFTLNAIKVAIFAFYSWGCFGFDSIRHWIVSTSGSVGQPVNLDLQTISWQQQLCTRCVVCKAHYLNPRGQGYLADEYPSSL